MQASKRPAGSEAVFLEGKGRRCPACGTELKYDYKSSGRAIRRLDKLLWVEVQIHFCPNGRCELRRKGTHPPEEWVLAPIYERFGSDVIAAIGGLRYEERLVRDEIVGRLWMEHRLKISARTVNRLFDIYGALVSGSRLEDPVLIRELKAQRVAVLSLDGAEPIKGRDPVWFVRETTSGEVLAAQAMKSCRAEDLVELLRPVKAFMDRHGIRVVGVVSDAEDNIRAAVRQVFPKTPHQLCQIHYVKNVAKSLVAEDRQLRKGLKKEVRGLRQIERDIRQSDQDGALSSDDAETLLDMCLAIRSVLKDNGKPPFEPPGLLLFERLIELQKTLAEMAREKGGPS